MSERYFNDDQVGGHHPNAKALTNELLPCPFCGGEAFLADEGVDESTWVIGCKNNDCLVQPVIQHPDSATDAIAAWNSRRGA